MDQNSKIVHSAKLVLVKRYPTSRQSAIWRSAKLNSVNRYFAHKGRYTLHTSITYLSETSVCLRLVWDKLIQVWVCLTDTFIQVWKAEHVPLSKQVWIHVCDKSVVHSETNTSLRQIWSSWTLTLEFPRGVWPDPPANFRNHFWAVKDLTMGPKRIPRKINSPCCPVDAISKSHTTWPEMELKQAWSSEKNAPNSMVSMQRYSWQVHRVLASANGETSLSLVVLT